ncbi:class III chitinase ChiA2 [Metarhizium brunneum]
MPSLFSTLASLALLASTSLAAPLAPRAPRAPGAQNVVYWGQNGGGVVENNDLAAYCTASSGIDIIVLAFLYQYGNGHTIPSGTIGQSCYIAPSGEGQNCDALAKAIDTCRANGVKVLLSLGGASGAYSLTSQQEAEAIGQNLWDAYGKPGAGSNAAVPRPFGNTSVDGWDFDIESNAGNGFYQFMIAKLRANFASDPGRKYLVTGAPQCPIPEPNMNEIITKAQFDYLWVQFYNNPGCSVDGAINFAEWKSNVAGTPSANAKIFIGVPASPLGATGTSSGARYYLEPGKLAALVGRYSSDPAFGGVMMWAAGFSDANVHDGRTYAQEAKAILANDTAVPTDVDASAC